MTVKRVWSKRTIEAVLVLLELKKATRSRVDLQLHRPARVCRHCEKSTLILVQPAGLCGECWSRQIRKAQKIGRKLPELPQRIWKAS